MRASNVKNIRRILVANRGEIALRVLRTCKRLGIETVAVHSEADRGALFVREADVAVCIGPAPSAESYLRMDAVIEAARRTGADAIHPGYGFLSENAAFSRACAEAGIVFIGPGPSAIEAMGLKREAKILAEKAGVPVVPGYDGANQDPEVIAAKVREIGFPVLLKASAGGGGKGMKLVSSDEGLLDAIASARREAEGAFGDGTLIAEKYVTSPRHVEIQILGDSHGNVVHLNERECSVQRRHQKIIEEAPSPALDQALRAEMGAAAVKIGEAIGYQNAGTVEFILGPDRSFYFLEVNTRLQVEHPVTECITGLDLVEQQIRIAEGRPIPFTQDEVRLEGAAIEVRIYAEDPAAGFLPQSGKLVDWHLPELEGVRVDGGVVSGDEVSIHYDPMLAKIIAEGVDRRSAIRRMRNALRHLSAQGIATNRDLLLKILDHEAFLEGRLDTHFIERELGGDLSLPPSAEQKVLALVAAALHASDARVRENQVVPKGIPAGFRNNPHSPEWAEMSLGEETLRVDYRLDPRRGAYAFAVGEASCEARLHSIDGPDLVFSVDGVRHKARVVRAGDDHYVVVDGASLHLAETPRFPDRSLEVVEGGCLAPMPGKVVEVRVAEGEAVKAGQVLAIMEAMKMEHRVTAPEAGVVTEVRVAAGQQVDADAVLFVVEPAE
jgi:acetyl-CoA carboxylase biotin carboxylase subunit